MKKKTKIENFYIDNPVRIDEQQIKECLLKLETNEDIADDFAKNYHGLLMRVVSNKFQNVLDYYLDKQEILKCEIGDQIKEALPTHLNRFFDALITTALRDLKNERLI